MKTTETMTKQADLKQYGIDAAKVNWNLSPEELQKIAVAEGSGEETANGTLVIKTGKFTGRSPQDRFIVKDDYTAERVWWGEKQTKQFLQKTLINLKLKLKSIFLEKKYTQEMGMCVQSQNTEQILEQ
ncbi:phosphoenolpyruvate carboxykinase [Algibacter lectus]|uniref:Phosphoenolpyruvate carboxykinase n=1 Tax=Algibacter lectus TaxID=221126 RepID=A0A090X5P6_9FLAO|nr:phosphoenolpyruvate carboxykinase (ATP) [Algibacter lectus]GAL79897.1 phosphoenolpyruvate carboxykinase [Algibacter lectus]